MFKRATGSKVDTTNIRGDAWDITVFHTPDYNGVEVIPSAARLRMFTVLPEVSSTTPDVNVLEIIGQDEIGEKTGHPHLQFGVRLAETVTLGRLKRYLEDKLFHPNKVYCKVRRFNDSEWKRYFIKAETFRQDGLRVRCFRNESEGWEYHELSEDEAAALRAEWATTGANERETGAEAVENSEKKSHRAIVIDDIVMGKLTVSEAAIKHPHEYANWRRNLEDARASYLESVVVPPMKKVVIALCGVAGAGKTHTVTTLLETCGLKRSDAFWAKCATSGHGQYAQSKLWFDGYDGQKIIIFDDFEGKCAVEDYLHLCDFNADTMKFEVKGGKTRLLHSVVIFTSNSPVNKWFEREPEKMAAAQRRVTFRKNYFESVDPKVATDQILRSINRRDNAESTAEAALYAGLFMELDEHRTPVQSPAPVTRDLDELRVARSKEEMLNRRRTLFPALEPLPVSDLPILVGEDEDEDEDKDDDGISVTSTACMSECSDEEGEEKIVERPEGMSDLEYTNLQIYMEKKLQRRLQKEIDEVEVQLSKLEDFLVTQWHTLYQKPQHGMVEYLVGQMTEFDYQKAASESGLQYAFERLICIMMFCPEEKTREWAAKALTSRKFNDDDVVGIDGLGGLRGLVDIVQNMRRTARLSDKLGKPLNIKWF